MPEANTEIKRQKHQETHLSHQEFLELLRFKMSPGDIELVDFAYEMGKVGHHEQKRDDGTPYIEHCKNTARIIMQELGIWDKDLIIAALLHDFREDAPELLLRLATPSKLTAVFGRRASGLIVNMTKPSKNDQRFKSDSERHQFYFQQLNRSNSWVKLIKLCDRLHNMRTIHHCAPEKRSRKIKETVEIYLPMIPAIEQINQNFCRYLNHEMREALETAKALPADKLGPPLIAGA
ncbi:MAG: HD domain-containing protein [Patescibacteria group bacterium]|jgi:(p)ppGpp synthase/HD superfamily hydrolase